jgi:hypothetical protein
MSNFGLEFNVERSNKSLMLNYIYNQLETIPLDIKQSSLELEIEYRRIAYKSYSKFMFFTGAQSYFEKNVVNIDNFVGFLKVLHAMTRVKEDQLLSEKTKGYLYTIGNP